MSNEKKLAVVLGGANGIGESTAELMVERGWRVAVVDLALDAAQKVAERIGASAYAADIGDFAAVEQLAVDIEAAQGPVSALVVCAASFQQLYLPQDMPMELFRKIMQVNVEGCFYANRVFGARMVKGNGGCIVNVSSINGHKSSPTHAYGPSKAAVLNMTKNLAVQWARSGVRVNSVSPGGTLVARVLARAPGRYAKDVDNQTALGRRIQPREVAEGIEFLASDRASAITGIDMVIDAGTMVASGWASYGGVPPAPEA
jgi:NAD(P)-dependent dehydrogenase (short-subunit alcohol dehydrogenase family)